MIFFVLEALFFNLEIPGPGLEQTHRCGGVTPVNVISPLIIEYKQIIKKPARLASTRTDHILSQKD
jgi:hypothetical protein